jgi:DNA polymerase-3 subunit epsilon
MNVIFWDTETNGLKKYHSVLSISAIKSAFSIDEEKVNVAESDTGTIVTFGTAIERYERFYFRKPSEALGEKAVEVNGLTDEIIQSRRSNAKYPENFCDDIEAFRSFCSDTRHFVGHNIFYDKQYINFWLPNMFCTMRANTKTLGLKRKNGKPKFPSLEETAKFYGIETDKNELHGSMYDAYITYHIFTKMLKYQGAARKTRNFLKNK